MISKKKKILNEDYKDIINNLDIGFFRVGLDGTILNHNPKFNEIFGISPNENLVGAISFDFWQQTEDRNKFLAELRSKGYVKNYVAHARKVTGEKIVVQGNSHLVRDEGGIPIATEGTIIDISEKYSLEQKLKASEEKYRDLTEFSPDIIFEVDLKLNLSYVNSTAFEQFGYTKEDVDKGINIIQLIDPEYRITAYSKVKDIFEGKNTIPATYLLRKKDGTPLYARIHSRPIIENGSIVGMRGTVTDINDRIITEKKLKNSEEKYRKLFENSPVGLMEQDFSEMKEIIDDLKLSGINDFEKYFQDNPDEALKCIAKVKIIDVNQKMLEVYNAKNKGEFISRMNHVDENMPEEILLDNKLEMLSLIKGDRVYESEVASKTIDGNDLYLYAKTSIVPGFENTWSKVILSIVDITDRKLTEQNLKESESKFRTIAEQSLMGICIIQDFDIKYLNQQIADIYGYPLDEVKRWKTKEFIKTIHPDSRDMAVAHLTKKQQGDTSAISHYIAKIITKNGNIRWVENYSTPIIFQGKYADLLTQIDITSKMEAENKIRISEEKYHHLYESSPYAILLFNIKGEIMDCNLTSEKLSGFTKEDLVGNKFQNINFIPKEYLPLVFEDFKNLLSNKSIEPKEIQLYTKKGELKWVSYHASIIYIEKEMVFQILIQDITDRKKAEQELIESEEKYHNLFETSPNGVLLTDLQGRILDCNSAVENISGYSPEDLIDKKFMDLDVYEEEGLDILLNGFKDLFGDNKLEYVELPIKHKKGHIIWVRISTSLITMKNQNYILAVVYNVTSQKAAEEAIKRSEEKYRDLLQTSSVGVVEIDLSNKKLTYINPKLLKIIGYERYELNEEIFMNKLVHQKDLTKILRSNDESDIEFRIFDKQGRLKWLAGRRIPNFNENNELIGIRVWLDDITEKKMYEELIYELNINFLNFTTDIRNNIDLLLNTGLKLLNGDLILYAHKLDSEGDDKYQIITSDNETYSFDSKEFNENLFLSELLIEGHDFPQIFPDIDKKRFNYSDPFIKKTHAKGAFGKVIKSQEELENLVCVFYSNNPLISGQDKLVLFLICDAIEIEQRRWQVQQDLEKQNLTLDKINKLKTELFSRTSHELKTPLISIKGFTELLLTLHKSKLDPETISILEEIKDGSKRLEKIINLLLESTKLEAGQLELKRAKEDLTFLINFCVKELKGLARLRNQTILFDDTDELEAFFDKERIYEVISNLLLNAVKYTPPGGIISIQTEIVDDAFIISVKDNGIGFTEEEKKQVFKQFGKIERYGQGWDVAIEGTGLGLYITKKLVELHNGKIWLESEGRNKGTTFFFSIPKL